MTRTQLGFICGVALFFSGAVAFAADTSDTDMAERYSRAARAGDDQAQFYLGALYSAGTGVRQSDAQAFEWISRAAQQGNSQAMLVLSTLFAIGRGVQRDSVSAYKWAYIVGEASHIDEFKNGARQLLALLETRMSPAEIAKAKSNAEDFHATKSQSSGTPSAISTPSTPNPADGVGSNPVPSIQSRPATAGGSKPASASTSAESKPAAATAPSSAESKPSERGNAVSKAGRNPDIDQLLNQVPPGLRQRYGF